MKLSQEHGFTLIELLIVVAIVAILAAIAIPQMTSYKLRAYHTATLSDLQNIRSMEEAMYADLQDYGSSAVTTTSITLTGTLVSTSQTVVLTEGVVAGAKVLASGGRNISYTATAKHTKGYYAYAAESEAQLLYRMIMSIGTALQDSDIPAATQNIDFTTPWEKLD